MNEKKPTLTGSLYPREGNSPYGPPRLPGENGDCWKTPIQTSPVDLPTNPQPIP